MYLLRLTGMVLALSLPVVVNGAVYQWRDSNGVTHFTDNADSVPTKYENAAKELPSIKGDKKAPTSNTSAASSSTTSPKEEAPKQSQSARLSQELKTAHEALAKKKEELGVLRRKYVVRKGRTPSKDELKEYEEKKAEGTATLEDNPYVNKSRLTPVAPARAAYYQKLAEVEKDEARVKQLEKELSGTLK
jgi:flagellar biosynthesis chaperone FliJ